MFLPKFEIFGQESGNAVYKSNFVEFREEVEGSPTSRTSGWTKIRDIRCLGTVFQSRDVSSLISLSVESACFQNVQRLYRCQWEFWEPTVADDAGSNVNDVLTVRCAPRALPFGIFTIGPLTDTLGKKENLHFQINRDLNA